MRRRLIAGNWKMNGLSHDLAAVAAIAELAAQHPAVDVALCLPATLIGRAAEQAQAGALALGGQDCHMAAAGAHTGCVAAAMLADAGATLVIVGHSERRSALQESDAEVRAKAEAALAAGLAVILCVGESADERDAGSAIARVEAQLAGSLPSADDAALAAEPGRLVVAYEPVWAIGTGRVPSVEDVAAMHGAIRAALQQRFGPAAAAMRILYGGSMNGANAAALLAAGDVDGGLIGGASLKADSFAPIVAAAAARATGG